MINQSLVKSNLNIHHILLTILTKKAEPLHFPRQSSALDTHHHCSPGNPLIKTNTQHKCVWEWPVKAENA